MNFSLKKIFTFKTLLIVGIIACLCCIIPFSKNLIVTIMEKFVLHRELRDIQKWDDILVHSMSFFALIGAFWFFFWYTAKGKITGHNIFKTFSDAFKTEKTVKYLLIAAGIFLFAYYSLIRANYEYADDIRRVYAGHKAWVGWSRYISETLAVFLHTNFFINDITPITQFVAIAVLAITSYLLAFIVTEGKITLISVIASTCAGITPYFLANFSYKYDCPYMAMSLLFGILPFLFTEKRIEYIFVSIMSLLLVCTSYQAANSIYIIMAIFTAYKMWLKGKSTKEITVYALISIGCYIAALVFFRLFLMNQFASSSYERGTAIGAGLNTFQLILRNYKVYFLSVTINYGNFWIRFFTLVSVVLFVISGVLTRNNRKIWSTLLMTFIVLFAMFSLSFGAYLALAEPLIDFRTFLGFDIIISLLSIFHVCSLADFTKAKKISYTVAVCLVYGLVVEAVIYGNFVEKQKYYEEFRFSILAEDLSRIVDFNQKNSIYIGGWTGRTDKARMETKNYKFQGGSVSPVLTQYLIKDYNMDFEFLSECTLEELEYFPELKKQLTDLPVIIDTYYHKICGKDNQYFVYLKYPMINE